MARTWQTDEVIRHLAEEADLDEVQELLASAGHAAAEALQEWIREGDAPKSLYDAIMRFTTDPNRSFASVDWEAVVSELLHDV